MQSQAAVSEVRVSGPPVIGYLVPCFPTLSETFVAAEIERLRRTGIDVRVASFSRPAPADVEKLTPAARLLLLDVHYVGAAEAAWAALCRPLATLRGRRENEDLQTQSTLKPNSMLRLARAAAVARWMRRIGATHLHAHWPYASQVAYLVHRLTGASYSISVHAHEVAHDNGHFPAIFPSVSFAAFCNRGAMDHLLACLRADARERSHLVYHGVDLDGFSSLPMPRTRAPLSIVSAGRLTRTKGFDRLIRACSAASREGVDLRLTILGRGSMEDELRNLGAELGLNDRLCMPGWVSQDELRTHLRAAHVFALLADTSFHDGLPNVVLEAMACGRPVILSPLPAANEIVTDGTEGFVLRHPDDVAGFVQSVRCLTTDPTLLATMGEAARRRVDSAHDADVQITHLARLLRGCLASSVPA
jgi:glycosyltransferase involved in cell wall biosynthesis